MKKTKTTTSTGNTGFLDWITSVGADADLKKLTKRELAALIVDERVRCGQYPEDVDKAQLIESEMRDTKSSLIWTLDQLRHWASMDSEAEAEESAEDAEIDSEDSEEVIIEEDDDFGEEDSHASVDWENYDFHDSDLMELDFDQFDPADALEANAQAEAEAKNTSDETSKGTSREWDDDDEKALNHLDALYADFIDDWVSIESGETSVDFEERTEWLVQFGEQEVMERTATGFPVWAWIPDDRADVQTLTFESMEEAKQAFDLISPMGRWMEARRVESLRCQTPETERRFCVELVAQTVTQDSAGRIVMRDDTTRLVKAFSLDGAQCAQDALKYFLTCF